MKTTAALLVLLAALVFTAPTQAQQSLRGEWRVEEVNGQQPPDGTTLTLNFTDDGQATVTYALEGDDPQSWNYTYTIEEGLLALKPKQPFGEPRTLEYEYRFVEGKLQLLEPKPEEEEDESEEDAGGEEAGEGTDDADTTDTDGDSEEGVEEEEEEDTREPVWVLVPAS